MLHLSPKYLVISVFFLASCSTFSSDEPPLAEFDDTHRADLAEAELEIAEVEINRLKEENARLASKLLAKTREQEATLAKLAASADEVDEAVVEPTLPESPSVIAEPPQLRSDNSTSVGDDNEETSALRVGEVPVAASPRLVQPTFTSNDAVFESEASEDIATSSILYGVHLASYRALEEARKGWRQLQRSNPDELGLLEPRTQFVTVPNKGNFHRLIGGGFSTRDKASALCESLKSRRIYCGVTDFGGEKLSLTQ